MMDYVKLIRKFHHGKISSEFVLFIAPPASPEEIESVRKEIPRVIPNELFDLYAACNGCSLDAGDKKYWFIVPVKQIADLTKSTERWYVKTHPQLEGRFHPFIDWSNGDSMGHLLSKSGELLPGLYCFEHEELQYDSDQDYDEFIVRWNKDIRGLLTKGAGND
tara:strand:- start:6391 stop:6879 length:489 start_codon:yes stop_codon:yes gene_type:complete